MTNAKDEILDLLEIADGARSVLAAGNCESILAENYSDSRTRE